MMIENVLGMKIFSFFDPEAYAKCRLFVEVSGVKKVSKYFVHPSLNKFVTF